MILMSPCHVNGADGRCMNRLLRRDVVHVLKRRASCMDEADLFGVQYVWTLFVFAHRRFGCALFVLFTGHGVFPLCDE